MTTQPEFLERERQRALQCAPSGEIDEAHLRAELATVPVAVLRRAAERWSAPRGRSRQQVIDGIVASLQNPHTNQGDSFRIALGHVRACSAEKTDRAAVTLR
jgi:hypothetical protein